MKLSTRLVLLILGCLLPILTAQIYSQITLNAERHKQLGGIAARQAERAIADMAGLFEATHQLAALTSQRPTVNTANLGCSESLTQLRRSLPQYSFLALFSPATGPICASDGAPADLSPAHLSWAADELTTNELAVGALGYDPIRKTRYLPVAVNMPANSTPEPPALLIAALSTGWLQRQLESARADRAPATMIVADRNGNIVSQSPNPEDWPGRPVPQWLRPFIKQQNQTPATITGPDGHTMIVASVVNGSGLTVINALALPDLNADIDHASYRDLSVIALAAFAALILAWVAGRRFIFQPTQAMLQAVRRWQDGDLTARARPTDASSEFAAIANAFNAMADGLQAQALEQHTQSSFLEAQFAERTRELSESNNRLQVEIAGREKTEAALHQAQKLQAVGQLAGGIAHDFNNMLATVLGNLELMERRVMQAGDDWVTADTDRMLRLIERATGAVTRGGQLTSRLLAFSRRNRLAARPTDVNALLRELITLASSTLGRRVQVVPELTDDLWSAMVDPSQVEAAILNLCLNARDAMPDGGRLTIHTNNRVIHPGGHPTDNELPPGDYVQVCISDTGSGMSPEVKARAFDPFFTTKGPSAGSGLGLSQVYGMARQSGGNVVLDSTPDQGTRVTLSLPRAMPGEGTATTQSEELPEPLVPAMRNELILVVDDDHAVRQVTVEMARDLGCEVAQASSGHQALALVAKLAPPPKLILLDYAMPGMNGLQLARALREQGITAPIALVTGYAELSEADIAASNLAGLLRKPFTIRELQGLLTQLRTAADAPCLEPGLADR